MCLTVKEDMCKFSQHEIDFLGYSINKDGIPPPELRVDALNKLEELKYQQEVLCMLGTVSYTHLTLPTTPYV